MAGLALITNLLVLLLTSQACLSYRPLEENNHYYGTMDDARRYIDGFLDYLASARDDSRLMTSTPSHIRDETFGYGSAGSFNVLDYGAVGDGRTDSSAAFSKAWGDFCGASGQPTLIIPSGKVFLLGPISFMGPCNSQKLRIQLQGTLLAPWSINAWRNGKDNWIQFAYVNGLTINGGGKIDGQGQIWWDHCKRNIGCDRPTALSFHSCNNLVLNSLHHVNSQRNHISIMGSHGVDVSHLMISAPENSPNTDGIDIATSSNLNIHDSFIGTGDDCIAVNGFTSHVNISSVMCGPGHGISIGSLGKNGIYETVEDVHVRDCTFKGTTNGARIKTWKGGRGYVRRVSFEDIALVNAENPIIIDQEYFSENAPPSRDHVEITDVRFSRVRGTTPSEKAVDINCVGGSGCKAIVVEGMDIKSAVDGEQLVAACNNAHGISRDNSSPKVSCLRP